MYCLNTYLRMYGQTLFVSFYLITQIICQESINYLLQIDANKIKKIIKNIIIINK